MYKKTTLILALILPLHLLAQDMTGLWKGVIYSDSTKENLRYEVGISEEKGKLTGFSHTFFIIDDKEYFGLKRIKIKKINGKYVIEDVVLIADNYPVRPPKGVHQISALDFTELDGVMYLDGLFTTTRTRDYSSNTGVIHLTRKKDFQQSALVRHLTELGLVNELSFVAPTVQTVLVEESSPVKSPTVDVQKVDLRKKDISLKKADSKKNTAVVIAPYVPVPPAAEVNERVTETIETVFYKSDSLQLTLYDNGEVDGDTVSVLMNGQLIMPNQGLSTKAIRKTIYLDKNSPDIIQLIMYAENLGSIPPNTGLLVVHDGEDIYEIRFSADMKKNAAIVFKRKALVH